MLDAKRKWLEWTPGFNEQIASFYYVAIFVIWSISKIILNCLTKRWHSSLNQALSGILISNFTLALINDLKVMFTNNQPCSHLLIQEMCCNVNELLPSPESDGFEDYLLRSETPPPAISMTRATPASHEKSFHFSREVFLRAMTSLDTADIQTLFVFLPLLNNFKGCRLFRNGVIIWEENHCHGQLFSLRKWHLPHDLTCLNLTCLNLSEK